MSYFEAQPRQARGQLTSALSSAFESEVASMFAAGVAFRASNQITSPVERFPQTFRQNRQHSLLVGTERLGTLSLLVFSLSASGPAASGKRCSDFQPTTDRTGCQNFTRQSFAKFFNDCFVYVGIS